MRSGRKINWGQALEAKGASEQHGRCQTHTGCGQTAANDWTRLLLKQRVGQDVAGGAGSSEAHNEPWSLKNLFYRHRK